MSKRINILAVAMLCGVSVAASACGSSGSSATQSLVAAGCKPAHSFRTVTKGTLTVGVISSLPYSSINPVSGQWQGIEANIAADIAKKECLTLDPVAVGGADAIQSLSSGKIDMISAGAYITPERGKVVGQTAPLYYQYTVTVSRTSAATAADLQGHQVGALSGSAYVDALRAALGASNVHEYPSTADLLADVHDGRIGAAVAASGEAQYQLKQAGYKGLTITRLSLPGVQLIYGVDMPYTKTNVQLGTALSQDIAALHKDGQIEQILTRWGMDDPVTLNGGSPGQ